jgi:hypothetical protein
VSFTSPVVEAVSMDLCSSSGESMHPDGAVSPYISLFFFQTYTIQSLCSQGDTNSPAHQDVSDDIQIPFLPLRHFDNSDWNTWAMLSKNIESWLVDVGARRILACLHRGLSIVPKGLMAKVGFPYPSGRSIHRAVARTVG